MEAVGLLAAGVNTTEVDGPAGKITEVTIRLGALQYGQSRDLYLRDKNPDGKGFSKESVEATLTYSRMTPGVYSVSASSLNTPPLSDSESAYHVSRSQVCAALGSLYTLASDAEHIVRPHKPAERESIIGALADSIPARGFPDEARNASLLAELNGEKDGQIPLAAGEAYFGQWGAHYLLGLKSAHERQACNSFKDYGPLMYGVDSPLFARCRDALDKVFDELEPPEGSLGTTYEGPRDMSSYRNVAGPCFAGETVVGVLEEGKGEGEVCMSELRRGMVVRTPLGGRRVEKVLKTPVMGQVVCRVGDVLVTPWHPVSRDGASWGFPAEMMEEGPIRYSGAVYSVLLEDGGAAVGHALSVGKLGLWGVTLGHGVLGGEDARAHAFLGDHAAVRGELEALEGSGAAREDGVVVGGGVRRDEGGLVCGFVGYEPVLPAAIYVPCGGMGRAPVPV